MTEFCQFLAGEKAPCTDGEVADRDVPDTDANEFHDACADGFDHTADLAVAPFGESDFEMSVFAGVAEPGDLGWARGAIGEFDAGAELLELIVRKDRGGFDQVRLGDMEVRVHDALSKLRVIGEKKQPGCIEVEPADGHDEGVDVFEQVIDGGTAVRILVRGDVASGFVKEKVDGMAALERLAVEADSVALHVDPVIGILDYAAIDLDLTGVNPSARIGTGAEPGFRDDPFEGF